MEKLTKENYFTHPALSNSMLSWILPETGGSVKKFEERNLFPQDEPDSASMRLGSLIHKYVEQKRYDIFQLCDVPSPAIARICEKIVEDGIRDLDSQIISTARSLDFQPTWKDQTIIDKVKEQGGGYILNLASSKENNKTLVTEAEMNQIRTIGDNISEVIPWNFDPEIRVPSNVSPKFETEAPFKSVIMNEFPVQFNHGDIECKSLIDIAILNPIDESAVIIDLKTTSTPLSLFEGYQTHSIKEDGTIGISDVEGIMYKRYIHRQLAFYSLALNYMKYSVSNYFVLVAETVAPYEVKLVKVPKNYIVLGMHRVEYGINLIKNNQLMTTSL